MGTPPVYLLLHPTGREEHGFHSDCAKPVLLSLTQADKPVKGSGGAALNHTRGALNPKA